MLFVDIMLRRFLLISNIWYQAANETPSWKREEFVVFLRYPLDCFEVDSLYPVSGADTTIFNPVELNKALADRKVFP